MIHTIMRSPIFSDNYFISYAQYAVSRDKCQLYVCIIMIIKQIENIVLFVSYVSYYEVVL